MNCHASLRRNDVFVYCQSAKGYDIFRIWTLLDRLRARNASELIASSKSFDATFVFRSTESSRERDAEHDRKLSTR
jgi:hypothetical protein